MTSPIVVKKNAPSGVIALTQSTVWKDIDPDGTAAARPLDLVIPGVSPGDWVRVTPNFYYSILAGNNGAYVDIFTVVDGVAVNHPGDAEGGIAGWMIEGGLAGRVSGPVSLQVTADDIENDSVRLRLRYKLAAAATRGIWAGLYDVEFRLEGDGPFA